MPFSVAIALNVDYVSQVMSIIFYLLFMFILNPIQPTLARRLIGYKKIKGTGIKSQFHLREEIIVK